jgi:hypothetical protein
VLNELLGKTPDERYSHLKSKLGWENTKETIKRGFDSGDLQQVAGVAIVFAKHWLNNQLRSSIDGALDPVLAKLSAKGLQMAMQRGIPVKLLAAEDDPLFPKDFYISVMGALGCGDVVEVIPGLHATVRSKAGAEQYRRLALWTKQQVDAQAPPSSQRSSVKNMAE